MLKIFRFSIKFSPLSPFSGKELMSFLSTLGVVCRND